MPHNSVNTVDRGDYMDGKITGGLIREIRKEKKMTMEQLSEKCGITPKYLGHIERGNRMPSFSVLSKIAIELNVTCEFLIRGYEFKLEDNELQTLLNKCSYKELRAIYDLVTCLLPHLRDDS